MKDTFTVQVSIYGVKGYCEYEVPVEAKEWDYWEYKDFLQEALCDFEEVPVGSVNHMFVKTPDKIRVFRDDERGKCIYNDHVLKK